MESSRILVAAAEPHVRSGLKFLFEIDGHEVRTAADGEEAWRAATSFRPDLVITDAALPRLDGLVLLAGLKARLDLAGVPVVVLVAADDVGRRVGALREGADACLPCPVNHDELRLRVRNLLWSTRTTRRTNALPLAAALAVPAC